MLEMLKNPVTLIFGLLAVFFTLMGIGRHLVKRRLRLSEQTKEKPYQISDPYAEPQERTPETASAPDDKLAAPGTPSQKKYFKEFGSSPAQAGKKDTDPSGYVWE